NAPGFWFSRKVEEQELGVARAVDADAGLAGAFDRVARLERFAVRACGAADEMQVAAAPALARVVEMLLLVAGREPARLRLDPDLQEMHRLALRAVVLAVGDAGARGHALHVARPQHRAVAHRVAMRERAFEHVAQDLHVAMGVRAEAAAGLHAVLVDHAQRPEAHAVGIVVVREREAVQGAQPAVVGEPAFGTAAALGQVVPFRVRVHEGEADDAARGSISQAAQWCAARIIGGANRAARDKRPLTLPEKLQGIRRFDLDLPRAFRTLSNRAAPLRLPGGRARELARRARRGWPLERSHRGRGCAAHGSGGGRRDPAHARSLRTRMGWRSHLSIGAWRALRGGPATIARRGPR